MNARPLEESYSKRVDPRMWRRLFRYTLPYKREVILLGAAAIGVAAFDTLFPLWTKNLIDAAVDEGVTVDLFRYAYGFLGLTAGVSFCIWAFIKLAGRIRTHVSHDIRRDGFENLQKLSFSFYDHRPVGWLMSRMTSDCERLSNIMAWGVLDFIWGITLMVGIATVMFILDARLALVVLSVVPLLAWASAFFQKRILESSRAVRKTNSKITASYNEAIMGVRTSKVFVTEDRNLSDFRGLTGDMYSSSVRNALQSALFLPIILSLGSVATGLALAVGGIDVTAGRISVGTLIAFLTYTRHFFDPIQELGHWFAEIQMAQASGERVLSLIDTVPEIRDSDEVRAAIAKTRANGRPEGAAEDGYPDTIGELEFKNVGFSYGGEGQRVLDDFSLRVEPGQTIALAGPTGGGKTTIVSLLCRFYEPTEGEIRLDGIDYRKRGLHWLQSNLGIVLQEPHLFRGSVADNIRYGRLEATPGEVEAASRLVGAHDFVTAMEKGYDSEVGEGGTLLSTGQKQLVSFARAVLADPKILVMDEATSSVDTETEKRIQRGLANVLAGRTSFVIAHRLSTIRAADRILVIDGGRIVESGTHRELLALHGRYAALYRQQSLRESVLGDEWHDPEPPAGAGSDLAPVPS